LETCGPDSTAFSQLDHLLLRNGVPITSGVRRFWDLRDPWVADYLEERVIGLLRDCGFGYLKVDYNETIGIGCDGAESPGEGLRQQIEATYGFFRRLREALPDLVIENCSSGGHRSEPSMLALTAMTSFSDAHETPEIPIIAANLHRAVLPRQSQVWAVLRQEDTPQRLVYSLAATFLGRMCLSGDLLSLTNEQWALVEQAQQLYRRVWPIIKHGSSYRYGPAPDSFRHPHGWQGVLRVAKDGQEALAVVHAFETAHDQGLPNQVELPLPAGQAWRLADALTTSEPPTIVTGRLVLPSAPFTGQAVHLVRA
jgi:alpha-galactosidase